jgi:hypothetical protein
VRSLALALALVSCHAVKPPAAAPAARDAGAEVKDDAAARAEAAWARRDRDPTALDLAIALWEESALRAPDPSAPLLDAARARRLRIDRAARAGGDAKSVAADAQACAADAHRSWAAQFPAAAAQLDGTHEAAQVYAQVGPAAAESLYLEAVCGAAWARAQGFTHLIELRGDLTAALRRVAETAADLDGAGAERELGMLYAALPAYAGGDLAEARKQFDAAIARAPGEARNRVALARTVAVKAQDRALFETELALAAKSDDALAAADAAALLAREDDLFGPKE